MEYFRNSRLYEALRFDRSGLGDPAAPGGAAHQARLDRARADRHRHGSSSSTPTATKSPTARPASSTRARPTRSRATGSCRRRPPRPSAGDYCTVGDIARRDGDGYYYLVDRKSNMIISGGENVYPSEVEHVLGAHPKIKDVAVIGVPDPKWGEAVHAVVILHAGASAHRGRHPRLVHGPDRRLQAAEVGLVHRARTTCREPPPARYFTACCATATPADVAREPRGLSHDRHDQGKRGPFERRDGKNSRCPSLRRWRGAARAAAEAKLDGGELVGRMLAAQGVKYLFAVNGGHTLPILAILRKHGVKLIHMRHEQASAYAADGWARTTGTPGVCCVTAGCGLTNAVTGLCVAGLAGSAVVCISGQHPTTEDGLGSFQEAYGGEVCRSFTKFTNRVLDWSTIEFDLRQAFREAMAPPQGVCAARDPDQHPLPAGRREQAATRREGLSRRTSFARRAIPRSIERAVDPARGGRPLFVGGDGVFWSAAAARAARLRRADRHPGLRPPRGPRRASRRSSAGGARPVEEAVHRPRRRGPRDRLSLLERREVRPAADLERGGALRPGRSDADPHRLACAGRGGDRRRPEARAAPADRRARAARLDFAAARRPGCRKSPRPAHNYERAAARAASGRITTTCRSIPIALRATWRGDRPRRHGGHRQLHA